MNVCGHLCPLGCPAVLQLCKTPSWHQDILDSMVKHGKDVAQLCKAWVDNGESAMVVAPCHVTGPQLCKSGR